jgi:hypothetical protein
MKIAHDSVNPFLDLEATVGDEEEEEEEEEEENDGASAGVKDYKCPSLQWHLLGGFIDDEPIKPHYVPLRQMDNTLDQDDRHDLVASLAERYTSGSKTIPQENDRNERPLDPVLVSTIENITRLPTDDDYPFWRVRCKVTQSTGVASLCI